MRKLKRASAKKRHGRAAGKKTEKMEKKVIIFFILSSFVLVGYFYDSWALSSVGEVEATIVGFTDSQAMQGEGPQIHIKLPDGSTSRTAPPNEEWKQGDRVVVEQFRRPITRFSRYQVVRVVPPTSE